MNYTINEKNMLARSCVTLRSRVQIPPPVGRLSALIRRSGRARLVGFRRRQVRYTVGQTKQKIIIMSENANTLKSVKMEKHFMIYL